MGKALILVFAGCFLCAFLNAQNKPAWVDRPYAVFPERLYVSARANGGDMVAAESNAKGALIAYFRQSISTQTRITDRGSQQNGRAVSSTEIYQLTEAVVALDSLVGLEIKDTWNTAQATPSVKSKRTTGLLKKRLKNIEEEFSEDLRKFLRN